MKTCEAVVLLVDDDEGDRELTRIALRSSGQKIRLEEATDGEDALAFLYGTGRHADRANVPLPDLILLDLNMPRMDGREFLAEISGTELEKIPIVVFTTSDAATDVNVCYELGCTSFISKPVGLEEFAKVISEVSNYWLRLVTPPQN